MTSQEIKTKLEEIWNRRGFGSLTGKALWKEWGGNIVPDEKKIAQRNKKQRLAKQLRRRR